jgi:hypothetical protein
MVVMPDKPQCLDGCDTTIEHGAASGQKRTPNNALSQPVERVRLE